MLPSRFLPLRAHHAHWGGQLMNDSYQQGPFLELVQPVRATSCNQCWYSPFIGGPRTSMCGWTPEVKVLDVHMIVNQNIWKKFM